MLISSIHLNFKKDSKKMLSNSSVFRFSNNSKPMNAAKKISKKLLIYLISEHP